MNRPINSEVEALFFQISHAAAEYCQSFVICLAEHPVQAVIGGIFVAFAFFAIHATVKCAQ